VQLEDKRILIDVRDNVVTFVNLSSQRKDAGLYKLVLKNSEGSNSLSLRVTVLDRPGMPEGPLDILNMDAESCTLQWKPPKDNGGNEVANYIVEKREVGSEKWTKVSNTCVAERCPVKGLDEGKRYEFRIMAENIYGCSDPLVTQEPVKAKWPFNPPGQPGPIECIDHSENSITIAWTRPKVEGGDPTSGYVVEKREKGSNKWLPVFNVNDKLKDTECTIKSLQDGKEYEFRVAAINRAGPGDWCETTEAIQARPADSAPKTVGFNNLIKEITIHAGEDLKINVPFVGSPVPKVYWTKGGDDVKEGDNISFSITNTFAQLLARKATLKDAGSYSCTLKNDLGQDHVKIQVNVVDRPGKPEGPLLVSDINVDSCVLKWDAPKQDGGAPITNYVIEKFDAKKNSWQKVSSFCRMPTYEVTGLEEGHQYKFRVSADNIYGRSDPLETDEQITAKNPITLPKAPTDLKISNAKSTSVTLDWNPPSQPSKAAAGSKALFYQVEMLKVGSENDWQSVNDVPIRANSYAVDNLKPGINYSFRVRAKNPAGWGEPGDDVSTVLKPDFGMYSDFFLKKR
jgi:hypothetical protein